MYIPKSLEINDSDAIAQLISDNSFGMLLSADLTATHLPFLYEPSVGQFGCLFGHFAKANSHWKAVENQRVLVVFSGPHAYISPTWYAFAPAVPTWNYAAVHCYGVVTLLSDDENYHAMQKLVKTFEPSLLDKPDVMPEDYQAKLRQAVIGFKIVIDDIQGKEKLGQQRKVEDQAGVYQALKQSNNLEAKALASYMEKRELGTG